MLELRWAEEVSLSVDLYLTSKNKIITTKMFLIDIFEVVKAKSIKVNWELVALVIRLIDGKQSKKGDYSQIALKEFIEFIKNNF